MLIQVNAFSYLKSFVELAPCREGKEFLCGLFTQLEQAWESGTLPIKEEIVRFLRNVLVLLGSESKHQSVQEWVKLVANTLGQYDWKGCFAAYWPGLMS
jgi:hypothetical protein